ncbi:DNA primase [Paraflavitalea sp. CAU 1676]|uniref:DNA primase n=1 Tax=Paraflavitalea sp. CAU 1676 TaxID=3032598 RepID=UPI0023DC89E3|nr:DNA primase [Paraflavitalea sp. CAU 1676]MDF2188980.1 DNA primase [Paraflavitalea sp. CAU 1676]
MISQQTIQQILSRVDVVEVVGSFVKLKKRGVNYIGLCPFHNEKSPSFSVSPTKEIYKCFGCGKSGNSISFLMEVEKYSYVEALRWLANKYNVEIEETEISPELKAQYQVADSLYIINQFAQQYFAKQLFESEDGDAIAMSYLRERGFNEDIIRKFQIGYCLPERDAFAKAALAAQYNQDYLQKTGLIVVRDDRPYDNYRGRIIFPIHNQSGKVLGFGARVIGKVERAPKYINTPENEIYHKSKILYGSYFARQSIDKNDECLLVEGYTDVVSLHQAGIENVVASGGTSLTPDQLRLVKKYTKNLTIIYDGDSAGVKAALRGLDLALEEGLNVKLVLIPDNEDPDSYVNKIGAEQFRDFVKASKKDFILFQVEILLKDAGDDTNKKAALVNQIAETISKLNKTEDFTKQQDYIRRCADLLRIEEVGLNNLVNKFIRDKLTKQEAKQQQSQSPFPPMDGGPDFYDDGPPIFVPEDEAGSLFNKDEMNERAMVRCLLDYGLKPWDESRRVADYIFEESVDQNMIDNKDLVRILDTYKVWYDEGVEPGPKNFLYHEDQTLSAMVVTVMDFAYEMSPKWNEHFDGKLPTTEDIYRADVKSAVNYLKIRKIRRLIDENQRDMQKPHNSEELLVLLQTHMALKQMEQDMIKQNGTVILK